MLTLLTPVDTSTGVLSDPKMIAETVKEVSPDTLVSYSFVTHMQMEYSHIDGYMVHRWSWMASAQSLPRKSDSMTGESM